MTYKTCLALLLFSSGIVLSTTSCKHNPMIPVDDDIIIDDTTDVPDDTTGMGMPCDPEKVYFDLQILPLLRSNCAKSGCHDEASHEEGIVLTSYEKVMTTGEVTPYNLGDSEIYEKMTETDPDKRMPPPPDNPLNADQINLIAKWILQGAQNLTCDPDAGNCNTDNITFSATVKPVIDNSCRGCHSGAAPSGGISLTDYNGIKAIATNGKLYGAMSHQPGYVAMPFGGARLSQCTIDKIKAWIDAGSPNN